MPAANPTGRRGPRPLVWVALIVLIVLTAVVAVVVATLQPGRAGRASRGSTPAAPASPTPTSTTPALTPSASPTPPSPSGSVVVPPRPPDDVPGPVIIVPGYGDDRQMLDPLASALRKAGRTIVVLDLPNGATGDLRGQSQVLAAQVAAELKRGAASVDLVGYSAGGIVVALYTQADPSHVRRAVSIGSPLHGTKIAGLARGLLPSACPIACEQMAPGSSLLSSLSDAAPTRTGVPWLSMWTSHDEVVVPPSSARFDGARNVELQSICADDVAGHTTMPSDPLVVGLTVSALDSWPIPFPTPAARSCGSLRALG